MIILDGKKIATDLTIGLISKVNELKRQGIKPKLCVFSSTQDIPSKTYVDAKEKKAKELGIDFINIPISGNTTPQELARSIERASQDDDISAIVVQLPLPEHLGPLQGEILSKIDPVKDVDDLNEGPYLPPTPAAILKLLEIYNIDLVQQKILLIGNGKLVGNPLAAILKKRNIPFEQADISTERLTEKEKNASLIITATGVAGLIKPGDISEGVVLVDAGASEAGGKMVGDADPGCMPKCSYIAPVPGGVGPLTIVMLMDNVVAASKA